MLDEPTDLPEGAEVNLAIVDEDEMGEEERARLHAALERSMAQAKAGKFSALLWKTKTTSAVHSSPAVADDGTVFVGSEDKKL
ncbi:MAG TPA: PQQ-binding-like beta-propeller repeat protein [Polyangiaceae bacterium]